MGTPRPKYINGKICPICQASLKNARGVAQHQRISIKCIRRQRATEGFYRKNVKASVTTLAVQYGVALPHNIRAYWVPTWFLQLVWLHAHEVWGPTTPVADRIGPRWLATDIFREEFDQALRTPARQSVLRIQHAAAIPLRQREEFFIRTGNVLTEEWITLATKEYKERTSLIEILQHLLARVQRFKKMPVPEK